jgi:hypothetical protein
MKNKLYLLKVAAIMAMFFTVAVLYVLILSFFQDGFLSVQLRMIVALASVSLVIQIVQFFTENDIEREYEKIIELSRNIYSGQHQSFVDEATDAIIRNDNDKAWQQIIIRSIIGTLWNRHPKTLIEITKELSRRDVDKNIFYIFRNSLFSTPFCGNHNAFVQKVFDVVVKYPCATAMIESTRDEQEKMLIAALDQAFLLIKYNNENIDLLAEIFARYLQEVIKEDVKNVLTDLCMKIMSAKPANLDMWTRFLREVKRELFPEEVKE